MLMIMTHPTILIAGRGKLFGLIVKPMLGALCLSVFLLPAMLFAEESNTSYADNWQSADNEHLLNQNKTDNASRNDDSINKTPMPERASEDPNGDGGDELASSDEEQLMDAAARPVVIPTYGAFPDSGTAILHPLSVNRS
ncbi:MAG: hypothetical protein Q9M23_06885 [Mariprofundaceae bacterium]|nr:hypothetical protein [Mariprofundaceae bacterium]